MSKFMIYNYMVLPTIQGLCRHRRSSSTLSWSRKLRLQSSLARWSSTNSTTTTSRRNTLPRSFFVSRCTGNTILRFNSNSNSNDNSNARLGEDTSAAILNNNKKKKKKTVEISPSDHGTTALESFRDGKKIDDRLVRSLYATIQSGTTKTAVVTPTPIQAHAIPLLLHGYDVLASSQTGSGKTLMFGLPLLHHLLHRSRGAMMNTEDHTTRFGGSPVALVVSPTRELAIQTSDVLKSLVDVRDNNKTPPSSSMLNICLATGGSDVRHQRQQLSTCDILLGTPGRIVQYLNEGKLSLNSVQYIVLDEADRLLDMGFEKELSRIAWSLKQRRGSINKNKQQQQTILCSATFPHDVQRLAADFLRPDYYFVSVGRVGGMHSNIRQRFEWVNSNNLHIINNKARNINKDNGKFNNSHAKTDAIVRIVKQFWEQTAKEKNNLQSSVIVFSNTKDDVERYGAALTNSSKKGKGDVSTSRVCVIHGDKLQSERNRAIQEFKSGKVTTLVATDVAARGLDVKTIGLVIQADAPRNIDSYTHRIGRTGRAGASGEAVTLLDSNTGFGIASGLVDLLTDAGQTACIPSWLLGMAHIANARTLDEEMKIQAGTMASNDDDNDTSSVTSITNEVFTGQDFRRTAIEGSYGRRDTSYRSFEEDAYVSITNSNIGAYDSIGSSSSKLNTLIQIDEASEQNNGTMDDFLSSTISFQVENDDSGGSDSNLERTIIDEDSSEDAIDVATNSFMRQPASQQLRQAIAEVNGLEIIDDVPDKSILEFLSKKDNKGNRKLRLEYLGMFPFDLVSPYLMSSSSRSHKDEKELNRMPRVLMVAEKPSIAKALADALSVHRSPRQRRGISKALPVYEFVSDSFLPVNDNNDGNPTKSLITVTSVVGHIFSLSFDTENNQTQTRDPQDHFHLPVVKKEESTSSKLRVIDHLRALAGESDHLVLWLDCDSEGENIAHEVIAITRQAIINNNNNNANEKIIHRARFSAISPEALRNAFISLEDPDPALSKSVDCRQELDLRIGVALTRLLTWRCVGVARKLLGPATRVISYGPCQTPALSFCMDRAREIEQFKPEKYWKVHIKTNLPSGITKDLRWKVSENNYVVDTRNKRRRHRGKQFIESTENCASYNQSSAEEIIKYASRRESYLEITSVKKFRETINPPIGLNTVALLEAGSKTMGMSPKQVMNVAEKLYSGGFISYPRTETTRYDPNGFFDARSILRHHTKHEEWGRSAAYLLRTKYATSGRPPLRGKDVGDHPPITPLKSANRQEVGGGSAWRVYKFIVENFIGSLHNKLSFTRTVVSLALPHSHEKFELELAAVNSLGFADCCRWVLKDIGVTPQKDDSASTLKEGQFLPITKARLEEAKTRPPRFLQEHELITLMDTNGIGTDASMAIHVNNIVDRGYVTLTDETGQLLRLHGPRRPGQNHLPRQIGRYLVPTALGKSLIDIFDDEGRDLAMDIHEDSPALLSHPSIREQMEKEVKHIATGVIDKEYCLEKNLDWFEERYEELEARLSRKRINRFAQSLTAMKDSRQYWRTLGAFEEPSNQNNHINKHSSNAKKFGKKRKTSFTGATKRKRKSSGKTKAGHDRVRK